MFYFFVIIAALAVATWLVVSTSTRRALDAAIDQTARTIGLSVPPELAERLRRRRALRGRLEAGAVLLGAALSIPVWSAASGAPESARIWIATGVVLTVYSIAVGAIALAERRLDDGAPRIARSRQVRFGDYLSPVELVATRALALAMLVLAAIGAIELVRGARDAPQLLAFTVIGAIGVVSAVVFEVLGHRLVRRAQPASSPAELAWDDGMRAVSLRSMLSTPLMLCAYGIVGVALTLLSGATAEVDQQSGNALFALGGLAVALAVIAAGVWRSTHRPAQHYLRRLWPNTAETRQTGA